jgi:hypothetical protein
MAQASNAAAAAMCGNKICAGNFPIMMLAIPGQWVAEVTVVLCLFGAT